jgi:MATE family multidrug resistance protein
LGLALNVFLNWVLIYGKFGLPALELDGAGYATSFTRLLMAFAMLVFVLRGNVYKPWLKIKEQMGGLSLFKDIFRI